MKNIMFTHNDLDGVGCAIVAKLVFDDIDLIFCRNPQDCTSLIQKEYEKNKFKGYDRIFVTDISFEESLLEDKNILNTFKKKLRMFDHHSTALGLKKFFPEAVIMESDSEGKLVSGTYLFHNYLVETYKMSPRPFFAEQIRLYDTWDWSKGVSLMPKYLNLLLYSKGISYFMNTFVERLTRKDINELNMFNQYERDILEFETTRNEKEICRNLSNVIKVKTDSCSIGVVNVTTGDYSTLGNRICIEHDVDIAFIFNVTTGGISVRSTRDDIDLGQLMKEAGLGGGHAQAAGGNFGELFVNDIVHLVVGKLLGDSVEISSIEMPKK